MKVWCIINERQDISHDWNMCVRAMRACFCVVCCHGVVRKKCHFHLKLQGTLEYEGK